MIVQGVRFSVSVSEFSFPVSAFGVSVFRVLRFSSAGILVRESNPRRDLSFSWTYAYELEVVLATGHDQQHTRRKEGKYGNSISTSGCKAKWRREPNPQG